METRKLIGKHIVTADEWFIGPDGEEYKGAYGEVEIINAKDVFGFTPMRSANWYAKIGTPDDYVIIAGCKVHFSALANNPPLQTHTKGWTLHEKEIFHFDKPSFIYVPKAFKVNSNK